MDVQNAFAPIDAPKALEADQSVADTYVRAAVEEDDAPALTECLTAQFAPANWTETDRWPYYDPDGLIVGYTVRHDSVPNGSPSEKVIKPFTLWSSPDGKLLWRCKGFPDQRPLYRLEEFAEKPEAAVLVVEGEKAADAAGKLYGDLVVVTSQGGSSAASKTDWSPLAGRLVVIWPDADEPGAQYADAVMGLADAAGALRAEIVDLPPGLPDGWDLADPLPQGLDPHALVGAAQAASSNPIDTGPSWEKPDTALLGTGRRISPEFPVALLDPFWADWCTQQAKAASAPVDYVALSLLGVAGALLANVRWPHAGATWAEPPILWCALVGPPSAGKSPAIDPAINLLTRCEERLANDFDSLLRQHETIKLAAREREKLWKKDVEQAVAEGQPPPRKPADAVVPADLERPRIRVSDATTEKLGALAASLPRGLLVVRDELAGWLGSFDRYGGGGADRAFAIEMYGGRPYRIDRKSEPAGIHIRNLSIGLLGGTQPDKLPLITGGADDGLSSRVLWA